MTNLTIHQLNHIIDLLENNESLPAEYKYLLFPVEKREYELVYANKEREENILADTMALPIQPIKTFGSVEDVNTVNKLIFGENLQALKTLIRLKNEGKLLNPDGSSGIKLVYIDPPFETKQQMKSGNGEKAYSDKVEGAKFIEFIRKRLILLKQLLTDDGTIYVHLDARKSHYIKAILDELFPTFEFAEIIWVCGLMGSGKYYPKAHETIFCYRSKNAFFSPPQRLGYSSRITNAVLKDENGWFYTRGKETSGGTNFLKTYISKNPNLSKAEAIEEANRERPQSAWDVWIGKEDLAKEFHDSAVGTYAYTEKEKFGYPTQKPEALLNRIIGASSREGEWVLDCFAGSGTTLAVAEKMQRKWIGIDSGKVSIYTIQKRLFNLHEKIGNSGKKILAKPFIVYNSGLYDFSQLKSLPWDDWRIFALYLFQCREEQHKVNGIVFDGYRGASDVLVFNFMQDSNILLDYGFIDDLHNQLRKKISSQVFIIAPAAKVEFLEDYIEKDEIRYYVLRIPYSIINELHNKDFCIPLQPINIDELNEMVDAVGFDFITLPEVHCSYLIRKDSEDNEDKAVIKIEIFKSKAMVKGATYKDNLETLSMVLIDYNYQGETFNLDSYVFADQVKKDNWEILIPKKQLGKRFMVIFMDIYGNEYREIKNITDFIVI